jgi:hypothetical protein
MSSGIVRGGGWAGVVAALSYVAAGTLILVAPLQRVFGSISEHSIEVLLVVAFTLTLVAIAGLHGLQRERYGRLGAAGSSMTFIGYALIAVVTAVTILVGGDALFAVRLIGALAILIGSVLLGAMTLRARVLPWWCGVLVIVGFPLGDTLDGNVARGGEEIVFGIVWGLVGYALLSRGRAPDQHHARVG